MSNITINSLTPFTLFTLENALKTLDEFKQEQTTLDKLIIKLSLLERTQNFNILTGQVKNSINNHFEKDSISLTKFIFCCLNTCTKYLLNKQIKIIFDNTYSIYDVDNLISTTFRPIDENIFTIRFIKPVKDIINTFNLLKEKEMQDHITTFKSLDMLLLPTIKLLKLRMFYNKNNKTLFVCTNKAFNKDFIKTFVLIFPKLLSTLYSEISDERFNSIITFIKCFINEDYKNWCLNLYTILKEIYLTKEKPIKQLTDLLNEDYETLIKNTETLIQNKQDNIEELLTTYKRKLEEIKNLQNQILVYQMHKNNDVTDKKVNELINFLDNNNNILDYTCLEQGVLSLVVKSKLIYYDKEACKKVLENTKSNYSEIIYSTLYDIFVKQNAYITCIQGVTLGNHHLSAFVDTTAPFVPNPHLQAYNCWGDNEHNIIKAISDGDYIVAITQVQAAISSLNFLDAPVLRAFIRYLNSPNTGYNTTKCITDNNGNTYTFTEYCNKIFKEGVE